MKYILFIVISFQIPMYCNGQVGDFMNLIITIDNDVITSTNRFKVIINKQNGSDTVSADYIPGKLVINSQRLTREPDEIKSIAIYFTYNQYIKGKRKEYIYQIDLPPDAIERDFNIINIFNLDKAQNGKPSYPTVGEKYVFDYIYPGGGRLTKRI